MTDREKVISGLEHCIPNLNKSLHEREEENERRHAECPYGGKEYEYGMGCFWDLMSDALELLKEQDAVEPKSHPAKAWTRAKTLWFCGACGARISKRKTKFCQECGRSVKCDEID